MNRSVPLFLILVFALLVAGCVAIPTKNEPAAYTGDRAGCHPLI